MPHAVLLMPHRRSSRACHEARRIVLGYSMIVPPAACVFTRRGSYQKQFRVSLSVWKVLDVLRCSRVCPRSAVAGLEMSRILHTRPRRDQT
jgi:hypothetical protein